MDSVALGCITAVAIIGLSHIGVAHDSLPIAAAASAGITHIAYVTVTQVFTVAKKKPSMSNLFTRTDNDASVASIGGHNLRPNAPGRSLQQVNERPRSVLSPTHGRPGDATRRALGLDNFQGLDAFPNYDIDEDEDKEGAHPTITHPPHTFVIPHGVPPHGGAPLQPPPPPQPLPQPPNPLQATPPPLTPAVNAVPIHAPQQATPVGAPLDIWAQVATQLSQGMASVAAALNLGGSMPGTSSRVDSSSYEEGGKYYDKYQLAVT